MKLKSLIVAALMLALGSAAMAQTAAPAKKHAHKKMTHVVKKHAQKGTHKGQVHKAKHKKAAAVQ